MMEKRQRFLILMPRILTQTLIMTVLTVKDVSKFSSVNTGIQNKNIRNIFELRRFKICVDLPMTTSVHLLPQRASELTIPKLTIRRSDFIVGTFQRDSSCTPKI